MLCGQLGKFAPVLSIAPLAFVYPSIFDCRELTSFTLSAKPLLGVNRSLKRTVEIAAQGCF